ncbi:hypothetical protein LOAG_17500 [Loa loa]|uniref:Uncharacterized protein n=1 Tax=Loa loa TaxID=7209 RepID=A0A1S0UIC6_LOALO|nr:hypothetical protein LOAG_17500 [Loa loa]EJD75339.1 hypothetical protein LOAG_17500 [Loa loa]
MVPFYDLLECSDKAYYDNDYRNGIDDIKGSVERSEGNDNVDGDDDNDDNDGGGGGTGCNGNGGGGGCGCGGGGCGCSCIGGSDGTYSDNVRSENDDEVCDRSGKIG